MTDLQVFWCFSPLFGRRRATILDFSISEPYPFPPGHKFRYPTYCSQGSRPPELTDDNPRDVLLGMGPWTDMFSVGVLIYTARATGLPLIFQAEELAPWRVPAQWGDQAAPINRRLARLPPKWKHLLHRCVHPEASKRPRFAADGAAWVRSH